MEDMLMIAARAAGDHNAWVCAHCETQNFGDTKLCVVCSELRHTTCDVECECAPRPASKMIWVDLSDPIEQIPLPFTTETWKKGFHQMEFRIIDQKAWLM